MKRFFNPIALILNLLNNRSIPLIWIFSLVNFWGITSLLASSGRYVPGLAIRSASMPLTSTLLSHRHRVWLRYRFTTHYTALMQNLFSIHFKKYGYRLILPLIYLCFSLSPSEVQAQERPIVISFMVPPPYPAFLSSYEEKLNDVIFTITNSSSTPQEIYFHGEIRRGSGERIATRPEYKPATGITLTAFETTTVTLSELAALNEAFSQQNMEVVGFDLQQIQRYGVVPEGNYTICITALDFTTNQIRSMPGTGCSNPFVILHAMPPRLNSPANGYFFCMDYGMMQFNWTPVQQAPGAMIVYDLEIIDMTLLGLENEDPMLPFVDGASRFYVVEDIPAPQYNYFIGAGDLPFEPNHRYGWRVRARDVMETTFVQEDGYSEAFAFQYCPAPSGGTFNVEALYPKDNDTIPFTFPYLAVRYSPQSDSYDRISYDLVITGPDININRTVNINWGPQGPEGRTKAFWPEASANQCRSIPLLRTADVPAFQHGKTYTWRGDITIHQGSHSYSKNILPQRFTYGMPKPKNLKPVVNKAMNPADVASMEFEFNPGKLSSNYLPPHTLLELNSWGVSPPAVEIQSSVNALWILQVSKNDATFENADSIIFIKSGTILTSLPQRGEIDKNAYKESIEKNVKTTLTNIIGDQTLADGTYHWRVGWSSDPQNIDSLKTAYVWSTPTAFTLDSDLPPSTPSSSSSDCMDDCETEAPSDQTTRKALTIGSEVEVGRYRMTIRQLSNPGASNQVYHGQGSIPIPFMNIDVKVDFQNLIANDAGKMYAGTVIGHKEEAVFDIDVNEINGLGIPAIDSSDLVTMESFLETSGRIVSAMTPGAQIGLPLGFDQIIDDVRVIIGIVEMKFTPTGATINAVANFNIREIGDDFNLGFGAAEICMHPEGFNTNKAELYLARDITIPIDTDDPEDPILITFKGLSHADFEYSRRNVTHIRLDCNGFKDGQVLIETTFPKSVFTALNADGTDKEDNLKATATGQLDAGGGILIGLTFNDRFYYTDFDDMSFVVENAWLDLSSKANPSGFSFPEGYTDSALSQSTSSSIRNGWTGFYMKNATAYFKYVHTQEEDGDYTNQFSIGVQNLILDHTGFSGKIYMANLIHWTENEDNLDGWAFALDTIDITFVSNNLISGSVAARLGFPMDRTQYLKTKFTLAYDHAQGKFKFTISVKPDGNFKVDAWAAQIELHQSSKIEISFSDEVDIKVDLTGKISIKSDNKEDFDDLPGSFSFPSLEFERIIITSKRGFEGGTINNQSLTSIPGTGGTSGSGSSASATSGEGNDAQRMAEFPISINSVELNLRGINEVVLGVDMMLTFTSDGSGLSGGTKLNFIATYDIGELEFTDLNVELEKIYLDINFDPIQIKGELEIKKTNLAGGGYIERFKGSLDVKLPAELRGRLEGEFGMYVADPNAEYGSEDHYSFFRIDGRVSGFSLTLTPWMAVTGFGGGFYHRMRIVSPCEMPKVNPEDTRAGEFGSDAPAILSGTTYENDYRTLLGFRVMLQAGFPNNDEVYNLDVSVGAEIAEDESGSIILQRLDFQGDIYVLTKISERHSPKIYAAINIAYENPPGGSPLISGNFDLYVDVKIAGLELLKGNMTSGSGVFTECGTSTNISCGCRAAAARLRIPLDDTAGEEWFFYMGHWSPEEPFGNRGSLVLNVVDLARVEISHYLMAGNGLPRNLPPLPPAVNDILNGPSSPEDDPTARAALASETNNVIARLNLPRDDMSAEGFAMGAYFNSEIDLKFAIFYAYFSFTLGFDINITKSIVECHNPDGPGSFQRGLDGWYGQGQAYMAMEGDLGVHIDLFFIKGKFSIVNLAAAVMIQAGIPNPEYFRGRVGLRYSILNGMVKGHCNFQMDVGQKCQQVNPNPFGMDLIADLAPEGGRDLSVFTVPIAAYNFPINEILTFEEEVDYDEYRLKHIKGYVDKFEIREGNARGLIVNTSTVHSSDNLQSRAVLRSWLKEYTRHHVGITMKAKEYTSRTGGGARQVVAGGVTWQEYRTVEFTTGPRPDYLPEDNVKYTYPIQRQKFYLQREGFPHIRVNIAMPGLMSRIIDGKEYRYYLRLIGLESRDTLEVVFPNDISNNLSWIYPGLYFPNLQPQTHYCLQIIRKPYLPLGNVSQLIQQNQQFPSGLNGSIHMFQNAIFGSVVTTEEYGDNDGSEGTGPSTSELTTTTITGADIAANEHLIYRYYFKTSKYDRLNTKMQNVNFTAQNPSVFLTPLHGTFDEKFDVFDINGFMKGNVRTVRPLVNVVKESSNNLLNSRINTDYAIYRDLESYMQTINLGFLCRRPNSFLTRNIHRSPFTFGIPPTNVIRVNSNLIEGPVSDADLQNASGSTTGSGGGASSNPFQIINQVGVNPGGFNLNLGGGSSPPPANMMHEEAIWFQIQHHVHMKRNINQLLGYFCFGHPNPVYAFRLFSNTSLNSRVNAFRNRSQSYYYYTPGTYRMRFASRPPSTNGYGMVRGTENIKSFIR